MQPICLGFGFPLLFVAAGLVFNWGEWVRRYWQVFAWFFMSLAFAYFPFWFQRKFIFGAHIPLCILAAISFDLLLSKVFKPRLRAFALFGAAVVFVPLLIATPIALLVTERREVKANAYGDYYLSDDRLGALQILAAISKPSQVVFATETTSRLIPALSGNTVVWGHWAMSVDWEEREKWFRALFKEDSNWNDEKRSRDFWGSGIQYIFADGPLKLSIERHPWQWWIILKDADRVFLQRLGDDL